MASDESLYKAASRLPYTFRNLNLLRKALTAGDTNSNDREGNRGLAQVGDALMSLVIKAEGFQRGLSRKVLEEQRSESTSKAVCMVQATALGLTPLVKISERQRRDGPQPSTIKNALAAIVAAVWLDSQMQYKAVVETMATLGLVNGAGPLIEHDESANTNLNPMSGDEDDAYRGDLTTLNMSWNDVGFDTFLDPNHLLGTEWALLPHDPNHEAEWLAARFLKDSITDPTLATPYTDQTNELLSLDDSTSISMGLTGFGYLPPDFGLTNEPPGMGCFDHNLQTSDEDLPSVSEDTAVSPSLGSIMARTGTSEANGRKRRTLTPRNDIRRAFKAYLSGEAEKLNLRTGVFAQHYGHMHSYQEALSSIKASAPKAVANMALAIGGCAAMQVLKQAIESIRSPSAEGSFRVRREMSCEERLDVIHSLDLRMANLRIARWLNIYKLYEDLSRGIGGKDADGFIILTNADLEQQPLENGKLAQRGNPRNLEQATITKRMMDHLGPGKKAGPDRKKSESHVKRLRRVGQRLQLLVKRWKIVVLCLLGTGFTDESLLGVKDKPFAEFLDVVDRFEGSKIQALSDSAAAAERIFMEDNDSPARLVIEDVAQDVLGQLPRLSPEMQELFKTASVD